MVLFFIAQHKDAEMLRNAYEDVKKNPLFEIHYNFII